MVLCMWTMFVRQLYPPVCHPSVHSLTFQASWCPQSHSAWSSSVPSRLVYFSWIRSCPAENWTGGMWQQVWTNIKGFQREKVREKGRREKGEWQISRQRKDKAMERKKIIKEVGAGRMEGLKSELWQRIGEKKKRKWKAVWGGWGCCVGGCDRGLGAHL